MVVAETVEVEAPSVDDAAAAWDAAAAAHAATRTPKQMARAAAKDERKAHKKSAKAAQRAKRGGAAASPAALPLPAGLSVARGGGFVGTAGSSHKPKRASARARRETRAASDWEAAIGKLEAQFGEDLCGLSGLVLAEER